MQFKLEPNILPRELTAGMIHNYNALDTWMKSAAPRHSALELLPLIEQKLNGVCSPFPMKCCASPGEALAGTGDGVGNITPDVSASAVHGGQFGGGATYCLLQIRTP